MKLKQKLLSTAFAVASLIGANSASAVIIGGVDFGAFNFHIETTTLAESLVLAMVKHLRATAKSTQ